MAPSLAAHVASRYKDDAAISKEMQKAWAARGRGLVRPPRTLQSRRQREASGSVVRLGPELDVALDPRGVGVVVPNLKLQHARGWELVMTLCSEKLCQKIIEIIRPSHHDKMMRRLNSRTELKK